MTCIAKKPRNPPKKNCGEKHRLLIQPQQNQIVDVVTQIYQGRSSKGTDLDPFRYHRIILQDLGKPFTDSVTYLTLEELGLKPKPKPTTTTNIDNVTANANPSGDNDYASGNSGTLAADNGTDGDDGNDGNDGSEYNNNNNNNKRNNKRGGSTLDKLKRVYLIRNVKLKQI